MNTLNTARKALLVVVSTALFASTASASLTPSNLSISPYVGVKAGQINIKNDSADLDKPMALAGYAGINTALNFGAEVEYSMTEDKEFIEGLSGEYNAKTMGAYGTYHLPIGNGMYAKGKLGYAQNTIVLDEDSDNKIESNGMAAGFGIGYNLSSNFAIEGEYTKMPSFEIGEKSIDADFLSIGAKFTF